MSESKMTMESRNLLLASAEDRFTKKGFNQTRVEDVLRGAGVSRATFYRYFSNLDDVMTQLLVIATTELFREAVEATKRRRVAIPDALARIIAHLATHADKNSIYSLLTSAEFYQFALIIRENQEYMAELAAPLKSLLERGKLDGVLRTDLPTEMMVEWVARCSTSLRYSRPSWAKTEAELEDYARQFALPALTLCSMDINAQLDSRLKGIENSIRQLMN